MNKALSYVSLAKRAGLLASGSFQAETAVKNRTAFLVLVAEDASENTKKHFKDMCSFRKIPMRITENRSTLGKAAGESDRTVVAVLSEGLAKEVLKALPEDSRKE